MTAETRSVSPWWQSIELRSTLFKVLIFLALNALAVGLSWVPGGPPRPDLGRYPYPLFLQLFPGGLRSLGEILLTVIGTVINWPTLRYLLLANLAGGLPLLFGAEFIRRLYEFDSLQLALEFLFDVLLDPALNSLDLQDEDSEFMESYRRRPTVSRVAVVRDGRLAPAGMRPRNRSIAWAGGPGKITLPPEYAAQLERGGRFTSVIGPGVSRLRRYERPYKLIDLRPIVRQRTVTALTRDGIPVTVEVKARCRIHSAAPPSESRPFPFDKQSIKTLIANTVVTKSGPLAWQECPIENAGSVLNEVLAKHRLDELFAPLDDLADPRLSIQDEVRRLMTQRARTLGVKLTEVWLGEFQLPPEVTEQYLEYWQAVWQRQDQARLADGQATAIRELAHARAEAQQLLIETLVAAFQSAQETEMGASSRQLVALRLIDGVEQLYRQARAATPGQDVTTLFSNQRLAQLRNAIQLTRGTTGHPNIPVDEIIDQEDVIEEDPGAGA